LGDKEMVVLKVVEMVVVVVVDIEWLTSRGCGPECAVGHPSGGQTWNRWSEWSELDRMWRSLALLCKDVKLNPSGSVLG
jgi:hypothetical protein